MTHVLVVDDERAIRQALAINLRARGYEVTAVGDGAAALAAAASHPPDVVILDLGLPDMDGNDVIEGLRGWSSAPIIVLSARTGQGDKVVSPRRGRRRLHHEAVRHGRAARPPARGTTAQRYRPGGARGRDRQLHDRPRREAGVDAPRARCG
jgi:CheY-like chemotaxis protein